MWMCCLENVFFVVEFWCLGGCEVFGDYEVEWGVIVG